MKVKFYLERKSSKSGENAIWCYVRESKDTIYINTKERINPEYWDSKAQRANLRKTRDNVVKGSLNNLNLFLSRYENKIFEIIRDIRGKDFNASFVVVSEAIKEGLNPKKNNFIDIYDEFLKAMQWRDITKGTMEKYKRLKVLLEDYQKFNKEKILFDKLNPAFYDKFKHFLVKEKEMIDNSAYKNLSFFKTFLKWCNDNDYTENTSYKLIKIKSEENEVIYLTKDELDKLYNLKIESDKLNRVRDVFVFQCLTGARDSDIKDYLTREDIKGDTWHLRTKKTHQIIEIPLRSYTLPILAKYSDLPQPLPVISNQKMNAYLKDLCKLAEMNELIKRVKYKGGERIEKTYKKYQLISTHTARRTFITLSLELGMKPDVIMSITGHHDYRMMKRYLKIADKHKRDEMDKVWGSSLRLVNQTHN